MSENIDVVNYALRLLGAERITSLEDEADEAQLMKDMYSIARDAVLEEVEWTFATRRFKPAKSSTVPEWGWASAFPIPSDIIRVTQVDRNGTVTASLSDTRVRNPVDHEVEGRKILCNEDTIYCKGIRRIDDEGIYSPLFIEAFAMKLALVSAYSLTETRGKVETLAAMYSDTIKRARSRDGMQSSTRRMRNQTLSRARY